MDSGTLVGIQIDEGQRLIDRLVNSGFPVIAAWWAKESDSGEWFLYLATPLVGDDGATRPAYRQLITVIRAMQQEALWIDPLAVKLVGPRDSVAAAVRAIQDDFPGTKTLPAQRLGDLAVESAYVYPSPQ